MMTVMVYLVIAGAVVAYLVVGVLAVGLIQWVSNKMPDTEVSCGRREERSLSGMETRTLGIQVLLWGPALAIGLAGGAGLLIIVAIGAVYYGGRWLVTRPGVACVEAFGRASLRLSGATQPSS